MIPRSWIAIVLAVLAANAAVAQDEPPDWRAWEAGWTRPQKEAVQEALIWTHHYFGLLDGQYGPLTRTAIQEFQAQLGHEPTGFLTWDESDQLLRAAEEDRRELRFAPLYDAATGIRIGFPFAIMEAQPAIEANLSTYRGREQAASLALHSHEQVSEESFLALFREMRDLGAPASPTYEYFDASVFAIVHNGSEQSRSLWFTNRFGRVRGFVWTYPRSANSLFQPVAVLSSSYFDPFADQGLAMRPMQAPVPPAGYRQAGMAVPEPPVAETPPERPGAQVYLMLGSFAARQNAIRLAQHLTEQGYAASVYRTSTPAFIVAVGPVPRASATGLRTELIASRLARADAYVYAGENFVEQLFPAMAGAAGVPRANPPEPPLAIDAVMRAAIGSGSGFIINGRGDIVTNHHVIDGCRSLIVRHPSGELYRARLQATTETEDLALLTSDIQPTEWAALRAIPRPRLGETVMVAGYPLADILGSELSVTTGTLSAFSADNADLIHYRVTAPVQSGNSGGPVLDGFGGVLGVTVAVLDEVEGAALPQNVNFVIKASILQAFLDSHRADYDLNTETEPRESTAVAETAQGYTVLILCLSKPME